MRYSFFVRMSERVVAGYRKFSGKPIHCSFLGNQFIALSLQNVYPTATNTKQGKNPTETNNISQSLAVELSSAHGQRSISIDQRSITLDHYWITVRVFQLNKSGSRVQKKVAYSLTHHDYTRTHGEKNNFLCVLL